MKRRPIILWGSIAVAVGLSGVGLAQSSPTSAGQQALDAATHRQQHLFILFYKESDAATQAMQRTLDTALAGRETAVRWIAVRTNDPAEKVLVDRWGLSRSPMPLALAVAPNGAITGGFPIQLTEADVTGAIVSPGTAACLKASQSRKLVLLCVYGQEAGAVPVGVTEFAADAAYGPATEVVHIRASDAKEATLLRNLKIEPTGTTVVALLVPPGSLLATFESGVTKAAIIDSLKAAGSSCCPGGKCGPGGCCPGGKCGPQK